MVLFISLPLIHLSFSNTSLSELILQHNDSKEHHIIQCYSKKCKQAKRNVIKSFVIDTSVLPDVLQINLKFFEITKNKRNTKKKNIKVFKIIILERLVNSLIIYCLILLGGATRNINN
jgi:hypothetical protein